MLLGKFINKRFIGVVYRIDSIQRYCYTSFKVSENIIAMAAEKTPFSRLPTDIRPFHYEITLRPDLKNLTFEGTQNVEIEVIIFYINSKILY